MTRGFSHALKLSLAQGTLDPGGVYVPLGSWGSRVQQPLHMCRHVRRPQMHLSSWLTEGRATGSTCSMECTSWHSSEQ